MYTPICGDHVIIHDEFIGYDFTTGGIINRTQYMPYELLYELGLHGFTIGLPVKFTPLYLMASSVPGLMGWSKWVWWVAYGGITLKGLLLSKHLVRGAEVSAQPASIWPSCCQTYLLYLSLFYYHTDVYSKDMDMYGGWEWLGWSQGRMNELNQRVSRLLVAVAKGKARLAIRKVMDGDGCFSLFTKSNDFRFPRWHLLPLGFGLLHFSCALGRINRLACWVDLGLLHQLR